MEEEEDEVQMANYSPAWRAHAVGGAGHAWMPRGAGQGPRGLAHLAHKAGPKAVQEPKQGQRQGQIAAARGKKKRKKNKGHGNWAPSVPAPQTTVDVQVAAGEADAGALGQLLALLPPAPPT